MAPGVVNARLNDEGCQIADGSRDEQLRTAHFEPRIGIVRLGLREQALCFRDFDRRGKPGLIADARLLFTRARRGDRSRRVLRYAHRAVENGSSLVELARERLRDFVTARLCESDLCIRDTLSRTGDEDLEDGPRHDDPRTPVRCVRQETLRCAEIRSTRKVPAAS
jgi:hypothetical protein